MDRSIAPGLTPFTGTWTYDLAAHLLRRCMFGPTNVQVEQAVEDGLSATIDQLLADTPLPGPPLNSYYQDDPGVPVGETWVEAPTIRNGEVNTNQYRNFSLRAWQIGLLMEEGVSVREKMVLFWHNHFGISNINDPKFVYKHISLLREHAWGNFRELVKKVTIDPAMLRFLNGNQNTNIAPNENYARELLELYTVGKGEPAGPGDYTTFTEADVTAIAKVLTGWRDIGYYSRNADVQPDSVFRAARHDSSNKTLSHRFDNIVIPNRGEEEYEFLVDTIFQYDKVARFISRKLYRWFVYYEIDDDVESSVIEPMAQILIDHNYEIKPVLEALFCSQHFFDVLNIGPMIKNPLDFGISIFKQLQVALPADLGPQYTFWRRLFQFIGLMEMTYFEPPSVAGWKAYYQEPQYYRTWINATTLTARNDLTNALSDGGLPFGGRRIGIDVLAILRGLPNPDDPNAVVQDIARLLFPQTLTVAQNDALKEILIPGLPDYEWTVEYGLFEADPENSDLAASIDSKLRTLFRTMLELPEYHLS